MVTEGNIDGSYVVKYSLFGFRAKSTSTTTVIVWRMKSISLGTFSALGAYRDQLFWSS